MSEAIGSVRTLKRKNVKGLALAAPAPRAATPSESDLQIPGGAGGYVECLSLSLSLFLAHCHRTDFSRQ